MKVLVAIDHSDASSLIIDSLSKTVWPKQSHFRIVHVLDSLKGMGTSSNISSPLWCKALTSAQEQLRTSALQVLQDFVDRLEVSFPDCQITSDLSEEGDKPVDAALLKIASDWQPDLIVIGSHGRRGLTRLLLGSVSFSVLCQSLCSVRIVKQAIFPVVENNLNVLLPVDDSIHSADALSSVVDRPWHPETRFRLLRVLPLPLSQGALPASGVAAIYKLDSEADALEKASEALSLRAESLAKALGGVYEVDSMAVRGDARDAIIEQAYIWPAGLIVMGAKQKTTLSRFFLGSVSSAVVLVSPCSVEVVRSAAHPSS